MDTGTRLRRQHSVGHHASASTQRDITPAPALSGASRKRQHSVGHHACASTQWDITQAPALSGTSSLRCQRFRKRQW